MYTGRDVEVIVRGAVSAAYEEALRACEREFVDAQDTRELTDVAYNQAIIDCCDAIRKIRDQYNAALHEGGKE